jgi:hypothetical protein
MGLPFDLEDVFGYAIADLLRRVGLILAVIYGGSLIAMLGLAIGSVAAGVVEYGSLDFDLMEVGTWSIVFAPVLPVISAWGVIQVPLILGIGFYCVKSEAANLKVLAVCAVVVGLIHVLAAPDPDWFNPTWYGMPIGTAVSDPDKLRLVRGLTALPLVLGCGGAFWFLAVFLERRAAVQAESHLMGVTIENEMKRGNLREEFGTEIAEHNDGFLDEP